MPSPTSAAAAPLNRAKRCLDAERATALSEAAFRISMMLVSNQRLAGPTQATADAATSNVSCIPAAFGTVAGGAARGP